MGQLLPPADRAHQRTDHGVFSLAAIIGPAVGGYLTDVFSWRAVFYVNLPIDWSRWSFCGASSRPFASRAALDRSTSAVC
jgi:MFS family permease